jgi:alpha-beta hydrolase superfamily lysophospholipase
MYIDTQAIRSLLPPFDGIIPVPETESIELYRAFYGVDYENRRAGLRTSMGLLRACGYDIVVQGVIPENAKGTVLVMQSTGAAIIIDYLLSRAFKPGVCPFDRQILLAPLIRPVNWARNKAIYEVVSPFSDYVTRKFALNSHDQEFLRFLKRRDPLQSKKLSTNWVGALKRWVPDVEKRPPSDLSPIIIQGRKDGTVDWRHNVRILKKKFNHPEVIYIPSARHQLVNESPEYRNLVFHHITGALG